LEQLLQFAQGKNLRSQGDLITDQTLATLSMKHERNVSQQASKTPRCFRPTGARDVEIENKPALEQVFLHLIRVLICVVQK
jgi:hypothetical protein